MEEERTRKGRWNRTKAPWIIISHGLAQALRRKKKAVIVQHDGITAKTDEIEAEYFLELLQSKLLSVRQLEGIIVGKSDHMVLI